MVLYVSSYAPGLVIDLVIWDPVGIIHFGFKSDCQDGNSMILSCRIELSQARWKNCDIKSLPFLLNTLRIRAMICLTKYCTESNKIRVFVPSTKVD